MDDIPSLLQKDNKTYAEIANINFIPRKRRATVLSLVIIGILFLTCCNDLSTHPQNEQLAGSFTPSPTSIDLKAITPSITPLTIKPPKAALTPTVRNTISGILPIIPTRDVYETVTPIATPSNNEQTFRLKDWTEQDALEMITAVEVYAHDNEVIGPSRSRFWFGNPYYAVKLAIREMQYRFPRSSYRDKLNWHLAMANAANGKSDSNDWILSQIEIAVNQLSLENLDPFLQENGFYIAEQTEVRNLFGDGRTVDILRVNTHESFGEQGLVFAIRKQASGEFKVVPIHEFWAIPASDFWIVDTKDHNKNGLPEVILETDTIGGMCFMDIFVYEWRNGKFVNLLDEYPKINECDEWKFGEPDSMGIDTITIHDFTETRKFSWNGKKYILSDRIIDRAPCIIYNYLLTTWSDYKKGITAIENVIQTWDEANEEWSGPYCRDYLRFQIGIEYAIQGQFAEAINELEELANSPIDSSRPQISAAAGEFLKYFYSTDNIFIACAASQKLLDKLAMPDEQDGGYSVKESSLCDFEKTFPIFLENLQLSNDSFLIQVLQESGVKIIASSNIDADNDGDQDWFIATDNGLWLLPNTGKRYQAVFLADIYGGTNGKQNILQVDHFNILNSSKTYIMLKFNDQFYVFQILNSGENTSLNFILAEGNVEKFNISHLDQSPVIEMEFPPSSQAGDKVWIYVWDDQKEEFTPHGLYDNDIFSNGGPEAALPYIQIVTSSLNKKDQLDVNEVLPSTYNNPKYLYLLGLAYELSGEEMLASRLFWEVWRDYPESIYAIMASRKIELVEGE